MVIPDLARIAVGEKFSGTLLVLEREERGAGNNPFVVLTLGNAHGRIDTAPFWSESLPRLAGVVRGSVVEVQGEVTRYHTRRQLRVDGLVPVVADPSGLVPAIGNPEPLWRALDSWRSQVEAPRIRELLAAFFDDADFRRRFERCPASVRGHHARLGGLLRHTWEVGVIARALCRTVPADPDLVLAGALLHDMGKLDAYSWEPLFDYTTRGHLLGHVVLGTIALEEQRARGRLALAADEWDQLHHLVLSHHGALEYGAPVRPLTLEAELLHHADQASARTDSMAGALEDESNFPDGALVSARGVWQLDRRRIFRGKSGWGL